MIAILAWAALQAAKVVKVVVMCRSQLCKVACRSSGFDVELRGRSRPNNKHHDMTLGMTGEHRPRRHKFETTPREPEVPDPVGLVLSMEL